MIELSVFPHRTLIFGPDEETRALRKEFTIRPSTYIYSKLFHQRRQDGKRKWDGTYKFVGKKYFSTGLLSKVEKYMKKKKIEYKIEWKYEIPQPKHSPELKDFIFRDYQNEVLEEVKKMGRGIINLPINSGKTEIGIAIMKMYGLPALYITHKKEIFNQTIETIGNRWKTDVGKYGCQNYDLRFTTVCMIQSLLALKRKKNKTEEEENNLKKMKEYPVIIMDEIHHYSGGEWHGFINTILSEAKIRIGLSATPFNGDKVNDWRLLSITGDVIRTITDQQMIKRRYSIPVKVSLFYVGDKNNIDVNIKYAKALKKDMIENEERNKIIIDVSRNRIEEKKQVLILVNRIRHGNILAGRLNCDFVCGITKERKEKIKDFKNEKTKILVTTLLGEGVNIPCIDVLVLATPFAEWNPVIQRIGRGQRKRKGKKIVEIVDFIDLTNIHMLQEIYNRVKLYKDKNFEIKTYNKPEKKRKYFRRW